MKLRRNPQEEVSTEQHRGYNNGQKLACASHVRGVTFSQFICLPASYVQRDIVIGCVSNQLQHLSERFILIVEHMYRARRSKVNRLCRAVEM